MTSPDSSIDIPFHVPLVHRLRFTQDVLGDDQSVLVDLLQPSGHGPTRVQIWIDQHLQDAQPLLMKKIDALCARQRARFNRIGPIELVPGGEEIKNDIHILEHMLKLMHAAELDRRSYVIVIGGGAVLDAVGFAAAIAHRGIRLVRLPTTTLAQADSGVGVKNSVNLFHKKNWIGTFAVPWGVINDASLLGSLSNRDFRCGFAEAIKVGLLKDAALFAQIVESASAINARDMSVAWPILRRSAVLHLEHITRGGDPFEAELARPLDFGHWSAHRMEALSDFRLRHGEAVAIGVAVDTVYSSLVHGFPPAAAGRVLECLLRLRLLASDPVLQDVEPLFTGLEEFRQHLGGQLTLTMLNDIGSAFEVHTIDHAQMTAAIRCVAQLAARTQDAWPVAPAPAESESRPN